MEGFCDSLAQDEMAQLIPATRSLLADKNNVGCIRACSDGKRYLSVDIVVENNGIMAWPISPSRRQAYIKRQSAALPMNSRARLDM